MTAFPCCRPPSQRGFTLIELMVGVAISLVIVLAVAAMYLSTAAIGRSNLRAAEIQSNGQVAMDTLRRDIINAGFRGLTGDPAQLRRASIAVGNDCAPGFVMNLRQAIWAANDTNPFSATCIPNTHYLVRDEQERVGAIVATVTRGRDVLAIRRLGIAPLGSLPSGRLHFRSAFQAGQYFVGSAAPTLGFNPAENYAADAVAYFIAPATGGESPPVPALYRVRLVAGPAMSAPELVASGIEDLQVQFDVRSGDDVQILDPGAGPLVAASAADSAVDGATGWENVVAVRVFLLVRAQAGEGGFAPGSREYTLGSRTVIFNDNIPRQVLSSVFSLRNR